MALTSTMCTSIHMSIPSVMCVNMRRFVCRDCVHVYEKHVSCETWIPNVCGSWHIGSKRSPNNQHFLQSTNIIFNTWRQSGACIMFITRRWRTRNMTNMRRTVIFKDLFSFETKSNFFEIKANLFSKNHFLLKQFQVLKTNSYFSSKHHYNYFIF